MSSSARPKPEPDIVSMYYKHMLGNVEPVPTKKWLDMLEEQIIIFLGKLFCLKIFDKPAKNAKRFESCVQEAGGKSVGDTSLVLFSIADLVNMLNEELLCEALPLISNLIFMTKQDFCSVKSRDTKKLVLKFQEMITSPSYLSSVNPHARMKKLMDVVDSIRKYAEYLLGVSGYYQHVGRSPREILRDIHNARKNNAI